MRRVFFADAGIISKKMMRQSRHTVGSTFSARGCAAPRRFANGAERHRCVRHREVARQRPRRQLSSLKEVTRHTVQADALKRATQAILRLCRVQEIGTKPARMRPRATNPTLRGMRSDGPKSFVAIQGLQAVPQGRERRLSIGQQIQALDVGHRALGRRKFKAASDVGSHSSAPSCWRTRGHECARSGTSARLADWCCATSSGGHMPCRKGQWATGEKGLTETYLQSVRWTAR